MGQCIIMTSDCGAGSDDCTATKSHILSGYKAITKDSNDEPITGTMPERNAWTTSVGMNGTVTIPEGHHNGSGKVNGPSVTQRGAWNSSVAMNAQITIPEGYHNGGGKVNGPSIPQYSSGRHAVGSGINSSGLYYYLSPGYYSPDGSGNSWIYRSLPEIAATLGITSNKVIKGNTICGVAGAAEGYVPGAGDLLYKGHNVGGWGLDNQGYIENGTAYARIWDGASISKNNSFGFGWKCSAKAVWRKNYSRLKIYASNTSAKDIQWYCGVCATSGSGEWAEDARSANPIVGGDAYIIKPGENKIFEYDITPLIITYDNCMYLHIRFRVKNKTSGYVDDSLIIKRIWLE